jgi:hypothetical protein
MALGAAACGGTASPPDTTPIATFAADQGRGHFPGSLSKHTPTPFCDGVSHAAADGSETASGASPAPAPSAVPTNCYDSNPPSSGQHLNVQRNVDFGGGVTGTIPPDPGVYPPQAEIPRDAIPHILEHAGVFVGYNCADGDADCARAVEQLTSVVEQQLKDKKRVVMARDRDLPFGQIGMSAWTFVDRFPATAFTSERVEQFLRRYSCRFDPEGFC